jgi:hypothetical protein
MAVCAGSTVLALSPHINITGRSLGLKWTVERACIQLGHCEGMSSGLETFDILLLGPVARQPKQNSAPALRENSFVSMVALKLREDFFVSAKYFPTVPGIMWNFSGDLNRNKVCSVGLNMKCDWRSCSGG